MPDVDLAALEGLLRGLDNTVPAEVDPDQVRTVARQLVSPGKGVLAADESAGTAGRRLTDVGIEATDENRRRYRQLLLGAPGLEEHVSGVILYDETVHQSADDGTPFPAMLTARGIVPGVKVDTGTIPLAGHPGEEVTAGLDGLRTRLAAYRDVGIGFAKWRAVIRIGDGLPTGACLDANAAAMARYAAICHEAGIVPMVEPEVLLDGDHDLDRAFAVTTEALHATFEALWRQDVELEGVVLKSSMVVPGKASGQQCTAAEVAEATVACLRRTVPATVPGVAFLSGGQGPEEATAHLDAINRQADPAPWRLTFSYARALQEPALGRWGQGGDDAVAEAQRLLVHRARCNGAAATGTYKPEMEDEAAVG